MDDQFMKFIHIMKITFYIHNEQFSEKLIFNLRCNIVT